MNPFLENVSEFLIRISDGDPGKLCVVFPNRRAGLFLRKKLAEKINGPVWSPEILTIEDIAWKISGLRKADTAEQLLLLYDVYSDHQQEKAEPFDAFCKWAPTLLNDLGEIDNYMKDAGDIFVNLADIKEIEQWSLNEAELTDFQKQYIHFWDSIGNWYRDFRARLEQRGMAYYGLAVRHAAEKCVEKVAGLGWKKIIFAGFNALTPSEQRIISSLVEAGLADTLWDCDRYYLEDKDQEAGKFLRSYRHTFLDRKANIVPFENITDELSSGEKNITVAGVARNVSQAKVTAQFLATLPTADSSSEKTAIVLADESLLFPLLHSLPFNGPVNVTMGYPLRNSTAASLFQALLLLQENVSRFNVTTKEGEIKFYHSDISRLIRHPLFAALAHGTELAKCWSEFLNRSNAVFCSATQLKKAAEGKNIDTGDALLLFRQWSGETDAIRNIKEIITACRTSLPPNANGFNMETEFLFHLDQLLNRAGTLMQKYSRSNDLKIFRSLMEQQIASCTVPFSGEPVHGLQVMGLLETRVLDFENVILLSANENILPAAKNNSTFIIFELRKYFGLPVFSDRDSIVAYHFYHLLQRARNIFITYNTDADLTGIKEKSRFVTQLLYELPLVNKKVKISESILDPGLHGSVSARKEISIQKDDAVMEAVTAFSENGFSPSSINNFISCPLKFYLHNVLGIREKEEVEESVDARSLGTIIHLVLENLYEPVRGTKTSESFYTHAITRVKNETDKAFIEVFGYDGANAGRNVLAHRIAVKYITRLLQSEKNELKNGASEILSLETEMKKELAVQNRTVCIKGKADRIEKRNGQIRVIDYKTGSVKDSEVTVKDPLKLKSDPKLAKALQLIMYGFLYRSTHTRDLPITSGLISFRKHTSGFISCDLEDDVVLTDEKLDRFENILKEIISDVFDTTHSFSQTEDDEQCRYCDFRTMCGREQQKEY